MFFIVSLFLVLLLSQDSLDKPVIDTPAQMMEDTVVTLNCSAAAPCADENPSIRWDDLLNGNATQSETTRADGNKDVLSILTFRASFLHNKKTLTCTAQYTVGSVNKTAKETTTLNVLYAPKKTSASSQAGGVLEGQSATLNCSSEANPPVGQYTWFRGNEETPIGTGRTLTFSQVTISQAGAYYCQARNTHGAETSPPVTLDVLYRPRNTSAVTNVHGVIPAGTSVTLSCTSKANPPANYTWFKVDGPSDSPRGFRQELLIRKATQTDSGSYVCQAENQYGRENSTALTLEVMSDKENITAIAVSISSVALIVMMVLCLLAYLQKKRNMKMENGKETQSSEGTNVKKPETDTTSEDDGMAVYSNNLVFNRVTNKRDNRKEVKEDNHLTYAESQKRKTQTTADPDDMALYFNNCSLSDNIEEIQDHDKGFVDNVMYDCCEFSKGKSQSEDEELQYASVSFLKFKKQEDGEMAKDDSPDVTAYDVLPCKEAEHSPAPEDTCMYAEVKKKGSSNRSSATH
ncbi:carcinoembryonic antigen-related cell adhesion molecule 5-like isoform X2 [Polypterus senegalus]|uniref:carcinoembryonic antigen-related cell adhesion molecule 5-like isoform X2 n=1 Tax=Polypterus senegalus TaxID=55291 RepID=UPI001963836E|nr:carcinoembryonic antigen-related cell adhesion molecule 5-like isoform X2 [Polypterus senegalus]